MSQLLFRRLPAAPLRRRVHRLAWRRPFCSAAEVDGEPILDLTNVPPIPPKELRKQFINSYIPFLGFGFMDNTIMIHAGDYIDNTFGLTFGLATLAAASCGQVFSDSFGVLFGNWVESLAAKLGLPQPMVTNAQRQLSSWRLTSTAGNLIGVVCGCLLGMLNLLFLDLGKKERAERQRQLDDIFQVVMRKGPEMFDCELVSLFLHDPMDEVLWSKVATNSALIEVPVSNKDAVCSRVYRHNNRIPENEVVVVTPGHEKVYRDGKLISHEEGPQFGGLDKKDAAPGEFVTKTMLAFPVMIEDNCVAVIEVINKHGDADFTDVDMKFKEVLADHVSLFMDSFEYEEHDRHEGDEDYTPDGQSIGTKVHYMQHRLSRWVGDEEKGHDGTYQYQYEAYFECATPNPEPEEEQAEVRTTFEGQ